MSAHSPNPDMSRLACARPEYQVVLRVERPHRDDPGGLVGLRRLLKALLRGYGLRAVSVLPKEPGTIPADAGATTPDEIDAALARRDFDAAPAEMAVDGSDPGRPGGPLDYDGPIDFLGRPVK